MSVLKTFMVIPILTFALSAPAKAVDDVSRTFAYCAGRLSAMVEHAWLMQDPIADKYAERLDRFLGLLDAVGDRADPVTLSRRIEAKALHAMLLRDASFGTNPERADWAGRRAQAQISTCHALLLDS